MSTVSTKPTVQDICDLFEIDDIARALLKKCLEKKELLSPDIERRLRMQFTHIPEATSAEVIRYSRKSSFVITELGLHRLRQFREEHGHCKYNWELRVLNWFKQPVSMEEYLQRIAHHAQAYPHRILGGLLIKKYIRDENA